MKKLTIKELSEYDRPMEKLFNLGPDNLSNIELLSIIIGSGTSEKNALELASEILNSKIIGQNLLQATCEDLMEIKGIGLTKATRIIAGIRLGRRLSLNKNFLKITLNNPEKVAEYLYEFFQFYEKEVFCAILLNTKNQPISNEIISVGTLNSSLVHPREVFKPAIKKSANGIILAHNHPSGDSRPSKEDVDTTRRLIKAGKILGINVYDHIVVGRGQYTSLMREKLIR